MVKIPRTNRSAFTFIEVLFAVILLGIGFIMIAAVFPVAIQQTSAVSDETQGTLLARDAIKKIQGIADGMNAGTTLFPATINTGNALNNAFTNPTPGNTPCVMAFSYNLTQALGTDSIYSADRRYGWVGFYRRDSANSPFAQVFVVALQNPNFPNYVTSFPPGGTTALGPPLPPILPTVSPPIPPYYYNFAKNPAGAAAAAIGSPTTPVPSQIIAYIYYDGAVTGNTFIVFKNDPASVIPAVATNPYAVTGAYVLIADDGTNAASGGPVLNGRVLRLGNEVPLSTFPGGAPPTFNGPCFQLQPGADFSNNDTSALYALKTDGNAGAILVPSAPPVSPITQFTAAFTVNVFIIGRAPTLNPGINDYSTLPTPFTGPNQDIGVASGYIRVNTTNN